MRQFIDDLNSSYVATSHTWVANILDQIGKLVRGLIRDKLSVYLLRTSFFRLAASIDLWHSKGNNVYIGIVVSFIDPSTFHHSIMTVGVLEFTESHSGENIIERIDDIILSFQIPTISHINDIFFSLSHDNCPNIVKRDS